NVLIIQSTPTPVVPIVDEATTQNDGTKSDLAKTNADNLDKLAELQALQRQEQAGTKEADHLGLALPSLHPILGVGSAPIGSSISAGSTSPVSTGSTPLMSPPTGSAGRPVSTGRPSGSADRTLVLAGRILGKFTTSASSERFPQASSVENLDIHDGLKIFNCPKSGIFTSSSYDEEFFGPDANNLESSLYVNSTITKRIHNIHPTSQVFGDINSPVQTKSQVKHKGSSESAFISYIHDQRRNNHLDFQLCLFSCFLSQEEPTTMVLVTLPNGKKAIGTKWILKNKRDAMGIVCRNKARLVAQGYRQEEGIDYTDVFAPVARIKAIRLFLAFASFMGFMVHQMDVKSAFLYGKIAKESEFEMSSMGPLTFFLGLQVDQRPDGIFIHQEKEKNVPDELMSVHLYRSMIGCLMYLTATKTYIMFTTCAAARHQVTPKTSNLLSVKQIFKYLTAYPKLGLSYPRDSPFDLKAFSDSDYASANGDRKSTTGGCQFLGRRLISW
nr:ribonuclease H-like domain, reverse transcriptase, RNA-dependent DNA polymerase [Tanacetum cinerariifolium]